MKIGVFVSRPGEYSDRRLKESIEKRGFLAETFNIQDCFIHIENNACGVYHGDGRCLNDLDAIIPRIEPEVAAFGAAVVRQFEELGKPTLNSSTGITYARDKLQTLQLLSQHKIPFPKTGFAYAPENSKKAMEHMGGAPFVLKVNNGTEGVGVILAHNDNTAKSILEAFHDSPKDIFIQEFIAESAGQDFRYQVIDGQVVGVMERNATKGEFRANWSLGASIRKAEVNPKEAELALRANAALGLDTSGIDILRTNHGPVVLEVNASAGLDSIEEATGVDVAGLMVDCLLRKIRTKHKLSTVFDKKGLIVRSVM